MHPVTSSGKTVDCFALHFRDPNPLARRVQAVRQSAAMTASPKNWRDRVWLLWFALQVLIVLCKPCLPALTHAAAPPTLCAYSTLLPIRARIVLILSVCRQVVDGVPWIYPAWIYQPEGSPLHFLQKLRDYDINTYNDPLIQEHSKSTLLTRGRPVVVIKMD